MTDCSAPGRSIKTIRPAASGAGLGAGWWDWKALEALKRPEDVYTPNMTAERRAAMRDRWREVLGKAKSVS